MTNVKPYYDFVLVSSYFIQAFRRVGTMRDRLLPIPLKGKLKLEREQIVVSPTSCRKVVDPLDAHTIFARVACEISASVAAGAHYAWLENSPFKGDLFHASGAAPLAFQNRDNGKSYRRLASFPRP